MGGCSSTGAHSHHRGARFDYDEWASQGADGWSFRDVLPYFLKSEDMRVPGLSQSGIYLLFMIYILHNPTLCRKMSPIVSNQL